MAFAKLHSAPAFDFVCMKLSAKILVVPVL